MNTLILILFDLVILLMLWIDTRHYNSMVTPFSVIGMMYLLLINVNDVFAVSAYHFYPISGAAKGILFAFLLLVFLIDFFFASYLKKQDLPAPVKAADPGDPVTYYIVTALFLIGLLAYCVAFLRLYRSYGLSIKGQNNGILGHLSYLAFILAPKFLYMTWKQKGILRKIFALGAVGAVFGIALLFGGKYVFFINLCFFVFYLSFASGRKIRFRDIVIVGLLLAAVAVIVFIFLYLIIPNATGQYQSSIGFAIEHFFYYLLSPVIANNYTLLHPGLSGSLIPVAFFVNLVRAFLGGGYVDTILGFDFRSSYLEITNVSGLFGELTYSSGIIGAFLYVLLIFTVINLLYTACRKSGNYALSCSYMLGILAFSFFSNLFTNSGIIEPLIIVILVEFILQHLDKGVFSQMLKEKRHGMDRS